MTFKPKSEKQLTEDRLAKDGDYDFQVLECSDETSKSGNTMIKLKLGIFHGDALRWHVYDYLVPQMEVKLRHFCDCTGLLADYESGTLSAQLCRGRAGRCRIVIEEGEGGYQDKNVVKDYILRKAKPLAPPMVQPAATGGQEDDVPFN